MANEKIINSRIQNKVDTETNWTTAGLNGFIPKNGEFIIYKEDEAHSQRRIKIGDGITPVHELPFITDNTMVETQLDDTIALTKTVPTNAAKYAEINELGGMTHKEEITTEGAIMSGPYTFSNLSVTIPMDEAPGGDFDYAVYLKNSGSAPITVMLDVNAGMWSVTGITVPADGQFHLYTGTSYADNYYVDWPLYVYDSTYLPPANFEASTITFYEKGGAPKTIKELRHAAVTEIKSASNNLIDISAALNECLRNNGDGTYTMTRTSSQRFSGKIPFVVKKEQVMFCQFEIVDTNIDGRNTLSMQCLEADGETPVSGVSFGLVNGGEYYTARGGGTHYVRFYIPTDQPVGAYITFRNPMIQFVEYYLAPVKPYVPYFKRTCLIPAEMQALEGYGLGVDATYYNYVDFDKKQFVQKVGIIDMGDLTYTMRVSNGRNIFGTSALRQTIRGFVAGDAPLPAIAVGYRAVRVNDTWVDGDMAYGSTTIGYTSIDFVNNAYTDAASFKAAMKGRLLIYALANPVVTDISDIIGNDAIEVEAGGTLTFVNGNNYDIPATVTYYIADNTEAKYAGEFIGDLVGTASSAVCDGEGNNIVGTYITKADVASFATTDYVNEQVNDIEERIDTAKQEAVDVSKAYTDKQLTPSPITFYDTEKIKENLKYEGTWGTATTEVRDGYAYINDNSSCDIKMGVGVFDNIVKLDYTVAMSAMNAGFHGYFLIGELNAVAGRTYDFPNMLMGSSRDMYGYDAEVTELYIAELDGSGTKARGEFVQTGSKEDPTMSDVSYPTGYYDAFTFTAPKTKTYGIWVHIYTNEYYWQVIYSGGDLVDLSSIAYSPVDKFATKEYVDSKVTESSGTVVTTDGVAQSTWDTNTKVNKTTLRNRVYATNTEGVDSTVEFDSAVKQYTLMYRYTNGRCKVGEPVTDDDCSTKKYVDDRTLTDSHKTILDFIASKVGTPNVVFGTDANGQLTAMSINDLAAAIMQALPAAEEGEF